MGVTQVGRARKEGKRDRQYLGGTGVEEKGGKRLHSTGAREKRAFHL